mmetsp:Transcript_35988/g.78817  ORF Transcript_35988/g.78817 Transcript_35988/m.78817 type:complete len:200 (-) Transcript_35988:620-1219(-)
MIVVLVVPPLLLQWHRRRYILLLTTRSGLYRIDSPAIHSQGMTTTTIRMQMLAAAVARDATILERWGSNSEVTATPTLSIRTKLGTSNTPSFGVGMRRYPTKMSCATCCFRRMLSFPNQTTMPAQSDSTSRHGWSRTSGRGGYPWLMEKLRLSGILSHLVDFGVCSMVEEFWPSSGIVAISSAVPDDRIKFEWINVYMS